MDLLILEDDEKYDKRCGEMFFTTKGRILFHCTLCDEKYTTFEAFFAHFLDMHLPTSEDLDDDIKFDEMDVIDYAEHSITRNSHSPINQGDDALHNVFEDISLETSLESYPNLRLESIELQPEVADKTSSLNNGKRTQYSPPTQKEQSFEIPKKVRDVRKHENPKYSLTPDEARKHKCPICGFGFKDRHNMIHHLKRHSDKRDHKCGECDKTFFTSSEVKIHMRVHTKERPYLCNECGLSFYENCFLLRHLKRHAGEKNFECKDCKKRFYDGKSLKRHINTHSTLRPFSCKECNAAFKEARKLKMHIHRVHGGKREFVCTICKAAFSIKASLSTHMKVRHKVI